MAQGETLGKRSSKRFPPRWGGGNPMQIHQIPQCMARAFAPPLQGG
jgi:hypothetical protein